MDNPLNAVTPNLDRIRLLVADLRTPGLLQARGNLTVFRGNYRETREDCCLGRACQVALDNGLEGLDPKIHDGSVASYSYLYSRSDGITVESSETAVLPRPVQNWYGIGDENPMLKGPDGQAYSATELNDDHQWNLEQIAYAFEVTYLGGEYPVDAITWPGMPEYHDPENAPDNHVEM